MTETEDDKGESDDEHENDNAASWQELWFVSDLIFSIPISICIVNIIQDGIIGKFLAASILVLGGINFQYDCVRFNRINTISWYYVLSWMLPTEKCFSLFVNLEQ